MVASVVPKASRPPDGRLVFVVARSSGRFCILSELCPPFEKEVLSQSAFLWCAGERPGVRLGDANVTSLSSLALITREWLVTRVEMVRRGTAKATLKRNHWQTQLANLAANFFSIDNITIYGENSQFPISYIIFSSCGLAVRLYL